MPQVASWPRVRDITSVNPASRRPDRGVGTGNVLHDGQGLHIISWSAHRRARVDQRRVTEEKQLSRPQSRLSASASLKDGPVG